MTVEELIIRFQEELRRRFRMPGKGTMARIQEQMGLGQRFFANMMRKGRRQFDLRMLLTALDALQVDVAEFFTGTLGTADPLAAFRAESLALRLTLRRQPAVLEREAARGATPRQSSAAIDYSELEALKCTAPNKAMWRLKTLISEAGDEHVPRLLGLYASACRLAGRLDEAQVILGRAFDLADERADVASRLELIQRSSYIVADRGRYQEALALAEKATLEYSRLGDRIGLGKSMTEQANWLSCLERLEPALDTYRAALQLLAGCDSAEIRRYRFSALMNSGIIHRKLGHLDEAERFGLRARAETGEGVGKILLGKLLTFQAAIARDRGKNEQAVDYLRESIAAHVETAPLDAAFSVVQLCGLLLGLRRSAEAYKSAKTLLPLLERLEDNPPASSCVTEILRCAVAGHGLTAELLQRVARGLKQAQAQARGGHQ